MLHRSPFLRRRRWSPTPCPEPVRPRRHRRDRPAHAGGGEPVLGPELAGDGVALNEIPPFPACASAHRPGDRDLARARAAAASRSRGRWLARMRAITVAGCLNVAFFTVLTAFAQLATTTSRVAISHLHDADLGSAVGPRRPRRADHAGARHRASRCAAGLAVLIQPLIESDDPSSDSASPWRPRRAWAAGTVYLKWARIMADPWRSRCGSSWLRSFPTVAGVLIVEGSLHLWQFIRSP